MDISIAALAQKRRRSACYEHVRLTAAPPRKQGRQRRYGPQEVFRFNFTRHSREPGFDMEAIGGLLAMSESPGQSCAAAERIARRRFGEVDRHKLKDATHG